MITLATSWDWPVWIWWPNVPVSYWLLFEVLWNRTASPDHRHLCHQQLEENICEVWNPRESCQWQRTAVQHTRNLFSDNHEFKKFTEEWGFSDTTSSLDYPQSNGATERVFQTARRILKKATAENKDPFEGLLSIATPHLKISDSFMPKLGTKTVEITAGG